MYEIKNILFSFPCPYIIKTHIHDTDLGGKTYISYIQHGIAKQLGNQKDLNISSTEMTFKETQQSGFVVEQTSGAVMPVNLNLDLDDRPDISVNIKTSICDHCSKKQDDFIDCRNKLIGVVKKFVKENE